MIFIEQLKKSLKDDVISQVHFWSENYFNLPENEKLAIKAKYLPYFGYALFLNPELGNTPFLNDIRPKRNSGKNNFVDSINRLDIGYLTGIFENGNVSDKSNPARHFIYAFSAFAFDEKFLKNNYKELIRGLVVFWNEINYPPQTDLPFFNHSIQFLEILSFIFPLTTTAYLLQNLQELYTKDPEALLNLFNEEYQINPDAILYCQHNNKLKILIQNFNYCLGFNDCSLEQTIDHLKDIFRSLRFYFENPQAKEISVITRFIYLLIANNHLVNFLNDNETPLATPLANYIKGKFSDYNPDNNEEAERVKRECQIFTEFISHFPENSQIRNNITIEYRNAVLLVYDLNLLI
jgi:hypothetical protein